MKAYVNKAICFRCGLCGGVCPDVFFRDDDGTSIALDIDLSGELLEKARHAELICPVRAITIKDVPPAKEK